MKTIEQILKECDNIYKPIGKDPEQDRINSNRIAGRYCIDAIQKWIDVEQELPEQYQKWHYEKSKSQNYKYYDYVLCRTVNDKVFICRRYKFLDYEIAWDCSYYVEPSIVSWRPIQYE